MTNSNTTDECEWWNICPLHNPDSSWVLNYCTCGQPGGIEGDGDIGGGCPIPEHWCGSPPEGTLACHLAEYGYEFDDDLC